MTNKIKELGRNLRTLGKGDAFWDELDEEIRSHYEMAIDDMIAAGHSKEEATRLARIQFGNELNIKEECMDAWYIRHVSNFIRDLKGAVKQLRENKLYTSTVLTILALCIGLNASAFMGIYTTLISPYIYPDSHEVVVIGKQNKTLNKKIRSISIPDFLDIEEQATQFAAIGLIDDSIVDVKLTDKPEFTNVAYVTEGAFEAASVSPLLGRYINKQDLEHFA